MQIKTSHGNISFDVYQDALMLRQKVFTDEQGFDADLDVDEYDKTALHVVLYVSQSPTKEEVTLRLEPRPKPIGVLRAIRIDENTLKVGRVAILPQYRGSGLGLRLMRFVEAYANQQHCQQIILSAQCHAQAFYHQLGYRAQGDIYDEEGVDHILMTLNLTN